MTTYLPESWMIGHVIEVRDVIGNGYVGRCFARDGQLIMNERTHSRDIPLDISHTVEEVWPRYVVRAPNSESWGHVYDDARRISEVHGFCSVDIIAGFEDCDTTSIVISAKPDQAAAIAKAYGVELEEVPI